MMMPCTSLCRVVALDRHYFVISRRYCCKRCQRDHVLVSTLPTSTVTSTTITTTTIT